MSVGGITNRSSLLVQSIADTRAQLDDLQRQLGTGQKSTTYAGLGTNRGLTVSLRNQLNLISGYADAATNVGVRIDLAQNALTGISSLATGVRGAAQTAAFTVNSSGQTATQRSAVGQLDQILSLLNTQSGDRYLFSGRATNQPAVDTVDHILNGDATHAGFNQVLAQRNQADVGANGLGRLVVAPVTSGAAALNGTGATISPDAVATVTGSQDLSTPYTSAGGMLTINGTNVTIPAGADVAAVLAAINAPGVVAATGVTATAPGGNLTLTQADDDTSIDLTGSTGSLLGEFGVSAGPANPTNLLTQGAVTAGQTLTIAIGGNPPLTVTFGTNESAVPPEVSTLAELNTALGTLSGGTASVSLANGNISIAGSNSNDAIAVSGTASPAAFGLAATTAAPANAVGLSEDMAGSPFGFKLTAISSTLAGATVSGPAGTPAAVSVNFQSQPTAGQAASIEFTLPDGSNETLTLTATTNSPPVAGQFTIGATPAATAANFQAALTTGVGTLASTALSAASAVAAGNDFFDGPPAMRVAGPPYDTATGLVAGTSANTIAWYTGETGTDPARGTAVAQIDNSLTVSYGARANEQALTNTIKSIAVYASMTYSASDPNAANQFAAVNQRVSAALAPSNGQQQISDIQSELAFAQSTMSTAKASQQQRSATLTDLLQGVEQANPDQVASQILALQTQLQASLQATASLYQLSIVNYIN